MTRCPTRPPPHTDRRPSCRSALLVESNRHVADALEYLLGDSYRLVHARQADAAWTYLQDCAPDLVITALNFERGMDGHELLEAMRKEEHLANTPVVVVSSRNQANDIEQSLALGAIAHLGKPLNPLKLLCQLESL